MPCQAVRFAVPKPLSRALNGAICSDISLAIRCVSPWEQLFALSLFACSKKTSMLFSRLTGSVPTCPTPNTAVHWVQSDNDSKL